MILYINPNKKNQTIKYRGIYSINFENGKRYIGLSNNITRRYYEHYRDAKNGDLLPVHKAMLKYNFELELLENCENKSDAEMKEQEIYWIAYYDTYKNKNKGYNLTPGGEALLGVHNPSAKLNENQIQEVYDKLLNNKDLFIYQIAEQYNISPKAISEINNGKRYYNEFLTYPLRTEHWIPKVEKGIKNHLARFKTQEDIDKVYNDIKNSSLSLQKIAEKYNVSYTTISKINRGLEYERENYNYPIRKQKRSLKLSLEQINEVCYLLINTTQSIKAISQKFNVSQDTIFRINKGETYKHNFYKYPLRANKEFNKAVSTISESGE